MAAIRMGIIGFGKIAVDQHVPAIAAQPGLELVAGVASRHAPKSEIPLYPDHRAMLAAGGLDAVAICTPPRPRYAIARDCLHAGLHCLLEKPPTTSLGELDELAALAASGATTLFTTWHAQFNEAVDRAAAIVHREGLATMAIEWLEDVDKWHPGQDWIWAEGGFGVFDAGINALSIATRLSPTRLILRQAQFVQQQGRQTPVAATLELTDPAGAASINARLDWRHKGDERWTITVQTGAGTKLVLSEGGRSLEVGNNPAWQGVGDEYPAIYARFAELIDRRQSLVDGEPQRLMADAFLLAGRQFEALG
jgi:D-galactose 1-dehydrogenase